MQQLEIASNYIIECVKKIQEDSVKSMTVRQECVDQLYEHIGTAGSHYNPAAYTSLEKLTTRQTHGINAPYGTSLAEGTCSKIHTF